MQEVLMQIISQLNSSVFVLLAILLIAFLATFKIGGWKQTFIHHSDRLDKAEKICDNVIAIQTKVDLIYSLVNPNSPTRSASPISLTPIGIDIVRNIKADDIFVKHANKLINMVENKKPKNAYDIQQVSFEVAKKEFVNLLDEAELQCVKQEAFTRGILVEDVLGVFGVLLRNKILADKNIPIADVDKHDQLKPKLQP
jgi:hypothetical protein